MTQCHEATVLLGLPYQEVHWRFYCEALLLACDEMVVLCLPGWEHSAGIARELKIASERGMPVRYIEVPNA